MRYLLIHSVMFMCPNVLDDWVDQYHVQLVKNGLPSSKRIVNDSSDATFWIMISLYLHKGLNSHKILKWILIETLRDFKK